MAVSGTGPLIFTDDVMYDDSSRINLEGYKTILPTNIQENATRLIGKCFILGVDRLSAPILSILPIIDIGHSEVESNELHLLALL